MFTLPPGHEDFTAEVDDIRAYGYKGPILSMNDGSQPIDFIMGLQPNDIQNKVTDLIYTMNRAPHPIVVNMDGGMMHYL
jgi:hypothetical protein